MPMTASSRSAQAVTCSLLLIFVLYFPLAVWLAHSYVPVREPPGATLRLVSFRKMAQDGFGYASPAQKLRKFEDSADEPQRSPVLVFEDGRALGPAHSSLDDITRKGQGRYLHARTKAGDGIFLSASDNSDPNTNGRNYWVVVP